MYELFRAMNNSTIAENEINIDETKENIIYGFNSSPAYASVTINGTTKDTHILHMKSNPKDTEKKKILVKPTQTITVGNYLNWASKTWLCTEIDSDIRIQYTGVLELCNYNLKFINNNGEIITRWCVRKEGSYGQSLEEGRYLVTTNVVYHIILPYDSETSNMAIDKRIIVANQGSSPKAYEITKVDTLHELGLCLLEVESTETSENDDLVNMIADYYSSFASYGLSILNGASLSINVVDTLQLNIKVTKTQGDNVVDISPTPLIVYSSSDEDIATVNSSGLVTFLSVGNVVVTAKLSSNNTVLDTISIDVTNVAEHNYTIELSGDSKISYNQTEVYTAVMKDNGVVVGGTQFDFAVLGSTPITKYKLTSINDTTCSVKCLGYRYDITLRCYNRADNAVFVDKVITLKGLV